MLAPPAPRRSLHQKASRASQAGVLQKNTCLRFTRALVRTRDGSSVRPLVVKQFVIFSSRYVNDHLTKASKTSRALPPVRYFEKAEIIF